MSTYIKTKTIRYDEEGERIEGREVLLNMSTAWYVVNHAPGISFVVYSESAEGEPHGVLVEDMDDLEDLCVIILKEPHHA